MLLLVHVANLLVSMRSLDLRRILIMSLCVMQVGTYVKFGVYGSILNAIVLE